LLNDTLTQGKCKSIDVNPGNVAMLIDNYLIFIMQNVFLQKIT